jgi:tRNA A37 threonylcarbamoyladenosine biosynthesis protein TsaE
MIVRSPTYTYYNKYITNQRNLINNDLNPFPISHSPSPIYHFDLYRIEDGSTFDSIGGREILENSDNIILVEWPDRIGDLLDPTKVVFIELLSTGVRRIMIEDF